MKNFLELPTHVQSYLSLWVTNNEFLFNSWFPQKKLTSLFKNELISLFEKAIENDKRLLNTNYEENLSNDRRFKTLNQSFTFGKYTNKTFEEIVKIDKGYILFCLDKKLISINDFLNDYMENNQKSFIKENINKGSLIDSDSDSDSDLDLLPDPYPNSDINPNSNFNVPNFPNVDDNLPF